MPSEIPTDLHSKTPGSCLLLVMLLAPFLPEGLGGADQSNPLLGVVLALGRGDSYSPFSSFAVHCQSP